MLELRPLYKYLSLLIYAVCTYFFYYVFVALFYEQKPLISKEKFLDSLFMTLSVFAFSFFALICWKFGLSVFRYFLHHLIGLESLIDFFQSFNRFLNNHEFGQILKYLAAIAGLSFTFFVPGFAWISKIGGQDSSFISAYAHTLKSPLKVMGMFLCLYGLLPLLVGFAFINTPRVFLSAAYALMSVFQVTAYLFMHDELYSE